MRIPRSSAALLAVVLAACGTTSPQATSPSVTPEATPAPPSAASPPGPTPTSATAAALAVIDGLRSFAADETRTYRVTFQGDSRHTTDILEVDGTLDVSGDDVLLRADFTFPGQGIGRTDYRRVDGTDWVRFDKGKWRSMRGVDAAEVVDPFAGTRDGATLQYLGPVEGKADRFRVQLDGVILHPALIPATNLDSVEVLRTRLELVTDGAGQPVSGSWSLSGTGRVSGQLQAIEMDLELRFSRIGEPVTIKAL